jgi:hypothetical protein
MLASSTFLRQTCLLPWLAASAQRDGVDYEALTAMMTLITNYIGQARGSQAMEAVQRVAGLGSPTP